MIKKEDLLKANECLIHNINLEDRFFIDGAHRLPFVSLLIERKNEKRISKGMYQTNCMVIDTQRNPDAFNHYLEFIINNRDKIKKRHQILILDQHSILIDVELMQNNTFSFFICGQTGRIEIVKAIYSAFKTEIVNVYGLLHAVQYSSSGCVFFALEFSSALSKLHDFHIILHEQNVGFVDSYSSFSSTPETLFIKYHKELSDPFVSHLQDQSLIKPFALLYKHVQTEKKLRRVLEHHASISNEIVSPKQLNFLDYRARNFQNGKHLSFKMKVLNILYKFNQYLLLQTLPDIQIKAQKNQNINVLIT